MTPVLEKNTQLKFSNWVESDPERLGGALTFRGTRVPIKSLFDHLKSGDSLSVFLDDFPGVSLEQAQAVLEMAQLGLSNAAKS